MTKKAYKKMVVGHLQWSMIGMIIALVVAFVSSDYRSVVYGVPAAESSVAVVSGDTAPLPFPAPAFAPKESVHKVVPDTINGALVWPDPWDDIKSSSGVNY